jgi:hypothetical protein
LFNIEVCFGGFYLKNMVGASFWIRKEYKMESEQLSIIDQDLDIDVEEEAPEKLEFTVETLRVELARNLSQHHGRAMKLNTDKRARANTNEPLVEYLRGHSIGYAEGFEEAMDIITAALLRSRDA